MHFSESKLYPNVHFQIKIIRFWISNWRVYLGLQKAYWQKILSPSIPCHKSVYVGGVLLKDIPLKNVLMLSSPIVSDNLSLGTPRKAGLRCSGRAAKAFCYQRQQFEACSGLVRNTVPNLPNLNGYLVLRLDVILTTFLCIFCHL